MVRDKWIIGVRNKLAAMCGECNSYAAIQGSRLTTDERRKLQELLEKAMYYIDRSLPKVKLD